MPELIPSRDVTRDAGSFSGWIQQQQTAKGSDVPCGPCTACCESGYFVHITPEDTDALSHVPEALLFKAPARPPGHYVMGFDEQGRCPMLQNGQCAIYEYRPQTCRDYDCRVFAATGIAAGDDDKSRVNNQAAEWRFRLTDAEQIELSQMQRVGAWLLSQPDAPSNGTQLALLSLELWGDLVSSGDFSAEALREALTQRIQQRESRA